MDGEPTQTRPLKVAILGKAPSSLGLAPFGDESTEIWTCTDLLALGQVPRWTRHFELHPLDVVARANPGLWKWLQGVPAGEQPIYLQALHPEVPAGVLYPKDAILARFGGYFTNTISWMIALAIEEGAKAISLFGVDMALDGEYAQQRPSCEYLLGWAKGAGIEVYVPPQADMLKTRQLYGFEYDDDNPNGLLAKFKARKAELQQRLNEKMAARDQAALEAAWMQGALETHQYYRQWL